LSRTFPHHYEDAQYFRIMRATNLESTFSLLNMLNRNARAYYIYTECWNNVDVCSLYINKNKIIINDIKNYFSFETRFNSFYNIDIKGKYKDFTYI